MAILAQFDIIHTRVQQVRLLKHFTILTRILLAIGFLPSGLEKVLGGKFTLLSPETDIGAFFAALYRTGFYWNFIGICQVTAAMLLLIPWTATLGAILYFPIILNIFVITVSLRFQGTPIITGLMLLASIYLLCWDYNKLKVIVFNVEEKDSARHLRL